MYLMFSLSPCQSYKIPAGISEHIKFKRRDYAFFWDPRNKQKMVSKGIGGARLSTSTCKFWALGSSSKYMYDFRYLHAFEQDLFLIFFTFMNYHHYSHLHRVFIIAIDIFFNRGWAERKRTGELRVANQQPTYIIVFVFDEKVHCSYLQDHYS